MANHRRPYKEKRYSPFRAQKKKSWAERNKNFVTVENLGLLIFLEVGLLVGIIVLIAKYG